MTTDKEELRNVINDSLLGFKYEEYGFTQAETVILIKVEKLLEAKDKEIDFQKRGFDFLYSQAKQEITDLKAEREAAKLYADSVARDAWDRACEATLLKIKTTFTDPKNLDKCDNVAILLRDAVKEIGSDILAFPKPEYQPK